MTITSVGDQEDSEMIFRGERREMIVVDHDDKSYMVIDEAMIDSISEQLSGYEAQMREALKDVPPEQRAMVEQMMKGRMPAPAKAPARPKTELRNTGERDTKNGYPSVKYEATVDGRKTQEFWVTDWDNVEGGNDAVEAFQAMTDFLIQMRDSMPTFGVDEGAGDNPFEHMQVSCADIRIRKRRVNCERKFTALLGTKVSGPCRVRAAICLQTTRNDGRCASRAPLMGQGQHRSQPFLSPGHRQKRTSRAGDQRR